MGHAINLASRMQSVAPPGGVVVSEETRRLVEGYFELHALGPTEVEGISEPINVYEVVSVAHYTVISILPRGADWRNSSGASVSLSRCNARSISR